MRKHPIYRMTTPYLDRDGPKRGAVHIDLGAIIAISDLFVSGGDISFEITVALRDTGLLFSCPCWSGDADKYVSEFKAAHKELITAWAAYVEKEDGH